MNSTKQYPVNSYTCSFSWCVIFGPVTPKCLWLVVVTSSLRCECTRGTESDRVQDKHYLLCITNCIKCKGAGRSIKLMACKFSSGYWLQWICKGWQSKDVRSKVSVTRQGQSEGSGGLYFNRLHTVHPITTDTCLHSSYTRSVKKVSYCRFSYAPIVVRCLWKSSSGCTSYIAD